MMANKQYDFTYYGKVYGNVPYSVIEHYVVESYPNFDHILIFDLETYQFVNPNTIYDNVLHQRYTRHLNWVRKTSGAGTQTGKVCVGNRDGYHERGKGWFSEIAFSRTREARKEYMEPRIRNGHIPDYYDWDNIGTGSHRIRNWKRTKVRKQFMKHTKHNKVSLPSRLDWDTDE